MSSLWVHFDPIVFFAAELVAVRCAATAAALRLRGGGARPERLGACHAPLTALRDASRPSRRYCVAAAFRGAPRRRSGAAAARRDAPCNCIVLLQGQMATGDGRNFASRIE